MSDFDNEIFGLGTISYPQPIALSCGRIYRARNLQERLDAILKCSEVLTRYLAAIAISSFCAREDANYQTPKGLESFTGHLTFGQFLAVVQLIAAVDCKHPLKDTFDAVLKVNKDGRQVAEESLLVLLNLRNDMGHDLMGVNEAKAATIFAEKRPDEHLKTVLAALDRILQYPLFLFEEQYLTRGKIIARQLLLMGESSDPLPQEIEINAALTHTKTLYIATKEGAFNL